jgi:hypothetical protein
MMFEKYKEHLKLKNYYQIIKGQLTIVNIKLLPNYRE